jgi:Ca2+-binding EF-hand superfamily protein
MFTTNEIETLFEVLDDNKDNLIEYREFLAIFKHQLDSSSD